MKNIPTILIDTAETHPWPFRSIRHNGKLIDQVPIKWQCLGRHPNSKGDYSIEGMDDLVGVERKSVQDLQGTILGFNDGRRERFEKELDNLSKLKAAIVVVEGTFETSVKKPIDYGTKSPVTQAKTLYRSIVSYQQDYGVPFQFCSCANVGDRRAAELFCFAYLERFWRKNR